MPYVGESRNKSQSGSINSHVRGVNEYQNGIARLQSFHKTRTAMGGAIVNNLKDTPCCVIGWLVHYIVNKPIKRNNAAFVLASAEQFGVMNIKDSNICPGAASDVFMFHFRLRSRMGGMTAMAYLDACFLIGRQNKLIIQKGVTIPYPFIEIQDSTGFFGKRKIILVCETVKYGSVYLLAHLINSACYSSVRTIKIWAF